jgi:LysR family nitrogen assimilation transcriptional regulator
MVRAERILAEFAEIIDGVRGQSFAPRGNVRFGMPATVGELLAVPIIEAAMQRFPEVRIRIVEAMSGYVLQWLRRGEVDLAMLYATSDPSGLAVYHALSEEICLFANSELALGHNQLKEPVTSFASTASLPLIVPGRGHGLRELIEDAALGLGVVPNAAVEIDSYSQIKKLVSRGLGFGILPRMAIDKEAQSGVFKAWRFVDPPITRKVYLAYSTERVLLTAPRAVGQLSWDMLRELVKSDQWIATLPEDSERPNLYP